MALAFMSPMTFSQFEPSAWPLFTTVETAHSLFSHETAIMIAFGGWGNTEGFGIAASCSLKNVKKMLTATGAAGKTITLDRKVRMLIFNQALTLIGNTRGQWRFLSSTVPPSSGIYKFVNRCPKFGGYGENYRRIPNSQKAWDCEACLLLLSLFALR